MPPFAKPVLSLSKEGPRTAQGDFGETQVGKRTFASSILYAAEFSLFWRRILAGVTPFASFVLTAGGATATFSG